MRIGELVWKIDFSDVEKQRLSSLLSDQSSEANDIFFRHSLKTRIFPLVARTLQRKVHGFRVNTPAGQSRAQALILKDLQKNRAPKKAWDIYLHSIASYVASELPALDELMREVEVDDETQPDSASILELIAHHSAAFEVDKEDIERIYNLWPFERQDDIEKILEECKRFDRFIALEGRYRELRVQQQQLNDSLDAFVEQSNRRGEALAQLRTDMDGLKGQFASETSKQTERIAQLQTDLAEKDVGNNTELSQEVADLSDRFVDHLTKSFATLEKDTSRLRQETDDLRQQVAGFAERSGDADESSSFHESLEEISQRVAKLAGRVAEIGQSEPESSSSLSDQQGQLYENLDSRCAALEARIEDLAKSSTEARERDAKADEPSISSDTEIEHDDLEEISDESEFLEYFSEKCTDHLGLQVSIVDVQSIHTLLKSSSLFVSANTDLIKLWIDSMGWSHSVHTIVASPVWTRPDDWQEAFDSLTSHDLGMTSVIILDYDAGLVENYLSPPLRLWRELGYGGYTRKLFLVSNSPSTLDRSTSPAEAFIFLDRIAQVRDWTFDYVKATSSVADHETDVSRRVSVEAFQSWCEVKDDTVLERTDDYLSTISEALASSNGHLPSHIGFASQRALAHLLASGLESSRSLKVVIDVVIHPWLEAQYGQTIASEFLIYAEANLS